MSDELSPEHLELMERIAAMSEAAQSITRVSAAKAALFLNCSLTQLAKKRNLGEPPQPAPHAEGGKQGSDVMYLVRTLVEYVKGLPISQAGAGTSVVSEKDTMFGSLTVTNSKIAKTRVTRHRIKWVSAVDTAESEDAAFPFFVDQRGLLLGYAWQSAQQTFDEFVSASTDVVWQTWVSSLAGVWADESERQRVLQECADLDESVPHKVQELRTAKLASI